MKFMKCFRIHIPFYFSEKTLVYQVNTIHKFLCSVELHCGAMIHSLNLLVADFSLDAMCGLSSVHGSSRRRRRRRRVHGRCRPVIGRVHWIDGSGSRSYNKREEESDIERKDDTTEVPSYQRIFQTSSRTSLQASQKMPLALLLLETRMKVILATRCTAEEEEEEASSAGEAFVPQAACCTALRDSKPRSSQLHRQCRQLVFFLHSGDLLFALVRSLPLRAAVLIPFFCSRSVTFIVITFCSGSFPPFFSFSSFSTALVSSSICARTFSSFISSSAPPMITSGRIAALPRETYRPPVI